VKINLAATIQDGGQWFLTSENHFFSDFLYFKWC